MREETCWQRVTRSATGDRLKVQAGRHLEGPGGGPNREAARDSRINRGLLRRGVAPGTVRSMLGALRFPIDCRAAALAVQNRHE